MRLLTIYIALAGAASLLVRRVALRRAVTIQPRRTLRSYTKSRVSDVNIAFQGLTLKSIDPVKLRQEPNSILAANQVAQWCRETVLAPFIKPKRGQFKSKEWIDMVKDPELRNQPNIDLDLVDRCAQAVHLRNQMMHGDALLGFLRESHEMKSILKEEIELQALLQLRPGHIALQEYSTNPNINAKVAILALHRLCDYLIPIPSHLRATCAQIRALRRPIAHPPVVAKRKALKHLNLLME